MRALRLWLATMTAILLVGSTSNAFAQAKPAVGKNCGQSGEPTCYLTPAHYKALEQQIKALEGRIQGFEKSFVWVPAEVDRTQSEPIDYHGWHGGAGVRGGPGFLTTSGEVGGLAQAYGLARWVHDQSHMGVELLVALGSWPINDSAPFSLSGRLAAVAAWEQFGLYIGPELSFLATPFEEKKGGTLLVTAMTGLEWRHKSGFMLRLGLGPTVFSEQKLVPDGLWVLSELGFLL